MLQEEKASFNGKGKIPLQKKQKKVEVIGLENPKRRGFSKESLLGKQGIKIPC